MNFADAEKKFDKPTAKKWLEGKLPENQTAEYKLKDKEQKRAEYFAEAEKKASKNFREKWFVGIDPVLRENGFSLKIKRWVEGNCEIF